MPNTRHSKCVECHIKVANYLIQILQQDKLNSTQISKKKKKKTYHKQLYSNKIPLMIDFAQKENGHSYHHHPKYLIITK